MGIQPSRCMLVRFLDSFAARLFFFRTSSMSRTTTAQNVELWKNVIMCRLKMSWRYLLYYIVWCLEQINDRIINLETKLKARGSLPDNSDWDEDSENASWQSWDRFEGCHARAGSAPLQSTWNIHWLVWLIDEETELTNNKYLIAHIISIPHEGTMCWGHINLATMQGNTRLAWSVPWGRIEPGSLADCQPIFPLFDRQYN